MNTTEPINYDLEAIYQRRSEATAAYRAGVWRILSGTFLKRWIRPDDTVLDLGSGHAEFINSVTCAQRFAMDLNPEARRHCGQGITFFEQDCSAPWPVEPGSLDVVFTSNFFEHLPARHLLVETLRQAHRALKPGGHILCIGPNIRYAADLYWDRFDHYIPLSHVSLAEVLEISGFEVTRAIGRFLPYSMIGRNPPLFFLHVYLRLPWTWRFFGKQFLVVAQKR